MVTLGRHHGGVMRNAGRSVPKLESLIHYEIYYTNTTPQPNATDRNHSQHSRALEENGQSGGC
jgi:hypothetical protein